MADDPDIEYLRARVRQLEEVCEAGFVNVDVTSLATVAELASLREQVDEARMWARHGYEIAQRSCTWSDMGVAPRWLTASAPRETPLDSDVRAARAYEEKPHAIAE